MIILSMSLSHEASVCVLEDGKVVYYCENERINHFKHSIDFSGALIQAMDNYVPDFIFVSYLHNEKVEKIKDYIVFLMNFYSIKKWKNKKPKLYFSGEHHWYHASNAFYGSGFDDSTVIVIDGSGKEIIRDDGIYREQESIFKYSYDNSELIWSATRNEYPDDDLIRGISIIWETICSYFFGEDKWYNAGKLMGASAYGENNPDHPRAYLNNQGNPDFVDYVKNGKISFEDASYRLQQDSFDPLCSIIDRAIKMTNPTNICLSGGFFMNVVNNYKLLKRYSNINFWIDPICYDGGISIGCAKHFYYDITKDKTKHPLVTPYLGNRANYDRDLNDNEVEREITPSEVARLIANRNVVALYQGLAEAGPRALGNRSILYDPRDPNGRDLVNTIKKREYYRPFAGTVLEEHAHEWFDLGPLNNSPFMMYAVETKSEKSHLVPALQHSDKTSRIQTINKKQNKHYYELISAFYNITGIPMVLNTSFNLSGDTMVDNMADAIKTCREGKIPYLYCPERSILIEFNH